MKTAEKKQSLVETNPDLLQEWDYERNTIKPEEVSYASNKKAFWICSKNREHRWEARVGDRTRKTPAGCPYCAGRKVNHTNCLSKTHPHLLSEWNFEKNTIKPEEISSGCDKKVFWVCKENQEHKWEARVCLRARQIQSNNCPFCAGRKVNHTNCLSTTNPHLLHEWDYERNTINPEEITAGSQKKAFWVCKENREHKWNIQISSRAKLNKATGCPYCSKQKVNHTNCLSTTHPHLLKEWDYEKNSLKPEEVPSGCDKKAFWICSKNQEHKWEAIIYTRTKNIEPSSCPLCSNLFSKGHQEVVNFISSFYSGKILINDRKTIRNPQTGYFLELDIFLPSENIAIEYNGEYYHSSEEIQKRDQIKLVECSKQNINLLTIWENDWKSNPEQTKQQIKQQISEGEYKQNSDLFTSEIEKNLQLRKNML